MFTKAKLILLIFFSLTTLISAESLPVYEFNREMSNIGGWIKYSVIGEYKCAFEKFNGKLTFDPDKLDESYVYMEIDAGSLKSDRNNLDKIAMSPVLLDIENYPVISFKSEKIEASYPENNDYIVSGELNMHGISKKVKFPFRLEKNTDEKGNKIIKASGEWKINRKEYDIYWHPYFDKGGILIGNHLNVEWDLTAEELSADQAK